MIFLARAVLAVAVMFFCGTAFGQGLTLSNAPKQAETKIETIPNETPMPDFQRWEQPPPEETARFFLLREKGSEFFPWIERVGTSKHLYRVHCLKRINVTVSEEFSRIDCEGMPHGVRYYFKETAMFKYSSAERPILRRDISGNVGLFCPNQQRIRWLAPPTDAKEVTSRMFQCID